MLDKFVTFRHILYAVAAYLAFQLLQDHYTLQSLVNFLSQVHG